MRPRRRLPLLLTLPLSQITAESPLFASVARRTSIKLRLPSQQQQQQQQKHPQNAISSAARTLFANDSACILFNVKMQQHGDGIKPHLRYHQPHCDMQSSSSHQSSKSKSSSACSNPLRKLQRNEQHECHTPYTRARVRSGAASGAYHLAADDFFGITSSGGCSPTSPS